jgi:hypothetical protein
LIGKYIVQEKNSQAMIKKFNEWVDYGQQESFVEKMEPVIIEMEKRMEEEGMQLGNIDQFIDNLTTLKMQGKFEDELENAAGKWFTEMYHAGHDKEYGEPIVSDEFKRIEKEVDKNIAQPGENTKITKRTPYNRRKRELDYALLRNVIEKHWNEWKAIYQKWIDYIETHRGELAGKRYGV